MKELRLTRVVDYKNDYSYLERITLLVGNASEVKAWYKSMYRGAIKNFCILGAVYPTMPKFNPLKTYAIVIDWQEMSFFIANSDNICEYLYDFAIIGHTNR